MPPALEFVEAGPAAAATRLDAGVIHLWRIPHSREQRRAPLRRLLAAYLEVPETAVELVGDARGKPALAPGVSRRADGRRLEFNWSHSGEHALVAIALDVALGVDIQRHAPNLRTLALAERFFAPAEARTLARRHGAARDAAFLDLWCAKEAVLKAAGVGLSFGLARLVFSDSDRGGWKLLRVDPTLGKATEWRLKALQAAPGYHGALAWRGESRKIVALRPIGAAAGS